MKMIKLLDCTNKYYTLFTVKVALWRMTEIKVLTAGVRGCKFYDDL